MGGERGGVGGVACLVVASLLVGDEDVCGDVEL